MVSCDFVLLQLAKICLVLFHALRALAPGEVIVLNYERTLRVLG